MGIEVYTVKRYLPSFVQFFPYAAEIKGNIVVRDRVKTSLAFSESLGKAVKKKVIDLDLDFSSAVEAACRAWIATELHDPVPNAPKVVPMPLPISHEALIMSMAHIQNNDPEAAAALRLLISRVEYRSDQSNEQPIDPGAAAAQGERMAEAILGGVASADTRAAKNPRRSRVSLESAGKVPDKTGSRHRTQKNSS